ncbi:MAG TPA: alpha/beta fold hydrolase [Longimicrobiales bacterium]
MKHACRRVLVLGALLLPGTARAQSFAVVLGKDTIAVERFTRTADRLDGELKTRGIGPRIKYSLQLSGGMPAVLRTSAYRGDADSTLFQSAVLTFKGDSVIADISSPQGQTVTQRIASKAGAFPFINPSFAMWEPVFERVRSMSADPVTVQLFTVSGGQTFPATIKRFGGDSAIVSISGVDMNVRVNERGDIVGATVPSQNLRVIRSAGALDLVTPPPDYSAPRGAAYTAQAVTITAPAGHKLAGTLTMPRQHKARVPVVVTISGSGQQDRDESLSIVPGYKPFRQIAEALAARGIATLRYDDRGFGASGGDAARATSQDFADDVRGVLHYLLARPDIDAGNIFLLGHSEGAMIAPMVAASDATVRGIVLMAGPSRTGRRILEYQNRYTIDRQPGMTPAHRDSLYRNALTMLDSIGAAQAWLHYFLSYDPLQTAGRVRAPVLILQGATDRQITADQAAELAAAFRRAGNRDVSVHVLPGVNHLFLADPDGNPAMYSSLKDRKVVANAVELITDWVVKHASATARPSK